MLNIIGWSESCDWVGLKSLLPTTADCLFSLWCLLTQCDQSPDAMQPAGMDHVLYSARENKLFFKLLFWSVVTEIKVTND